MYKIEPVLNQAGIARAFPWNDRGSQQQMLSVKVGEHEGDMKGKAGLVQGHQVLQRGCVRAEDGPCVSALFQLVLKKFDPLCIVAVRLAWQV